MQMRLLAFFHALAVGLIINIATAQDATSNRPSAEVALSNDTLELRYITSGKKIDVERSRASIGFFLSEERDVVFDAGLLVPADVDVERLTILLGPRAYAALLSEENEDVLAMAVGAELRFDLERRSGLAIVGHAYYSPDILTFGSADNLSDLSARAQIRLGPQLTGFAGMRWFEFDLTEGGGTRTLQEEVFVGVGWRF
jgi:hypothetical protein